MNNYLSDIIGTGADAFSNLFKVDFRWPNNNLGDLNDQINNLSARIENFSAPEKSVVTTTLNYQNTFINVPLPANSNTSKKSTFRFRVDENYLLYSALKQYIPLRNYSDFDLNSFYSKDDTSLQITVTSYKPGGSEGDIPIYEWKFSGCRVLSVAEVTYEYSNSNALTINVEFSWDSMVEGYPTESEQR